MSTPLLLLASTSSSRRAVLDTTGFAYTTASPDVDERAVVAARRDAGEPVSPGDEARLLAEAKAQDVAARPASAGHLVLGCDSVFELDGTAYGKPHTAEVARQRWVGMSGRTGILHTGHTLIDTGTAAHRTVSELVSTYVTFAEVTQEEIADYVATGEPLGCAGAFTVDGRAAALVSRIDGDFHAVVGVSPACLRRLSKALGHGLDRLTTSPTP